jgi:hypothetical protein
MPTGKWHVWAVLCNGIRCAGCCSQRNPWATDGAQGQRWLSTDARFLKVGGLGFVRQTAARILPRHGATRMWGCNGMVPGPTNKVSRGVETVVRVRNKLPAQHSEFGHEFNTSTHLHGSASLPQYDGYADDLTHPGYYKDCSEGVRDVTAVDACLGRVRGSRCPTAGDHPACANGSGVDSSPAVRWVSITRRSTLPR